MLTRSLSVLALAISCASWTRPWLWGLGADDAVLVEPLVASQEFSCSGKCSCPVLTERAAAPAGPGRLVLLAGGWGLLIAGYACGRWTPCEAPKVVESVLWRAALPQLTDAPRRRGGGVLV